MRPVIQVSAIRKTYGSTVAVDEVSFEINNGEIFGLIGPNGAGKTTTMECIDGLRTPDRGAISVLGLDPSNDVYKLQDRIGVQLQQAQLQKRIKVWEAVDLWASLYQKNAIDGERLLEGNPLTFQSFTKPLQNADKRSAPEMSTHVCKAAACIWRLERASPASRAAWNPIDS
jgi:ABC-2 type transport system ATP-binding protein